MTASIKVISSMATRKILESLLEMYERSAGCVVELHSLGGVEAAKTVRAGANADVVILASPVIEQLEIEGYVVRGSRQNFAKSGIAIAVRVGAQKPAINDEESVKQAMLVANRIGFSTGPSGDHLKRLWSNWGISEAMAQRAVQAPAGVPVAQLLTRGDVDLGFQQMSEFIGVDCVEIVGLLPPAIQTTTIFAAGVAKSSSNVKLAGHLIGFLVSANSLNIKYQNGMDGL